MSEIIRLEALSAGYETKAVVSDVNISINRGEIVTIIGVNGAGKSTLLKTIAGILPRVAGKIIIDGTDIGDMDSQVLARKIAILLTDKINADYMTVSDIVATGRYAYTGRLGLLTEDDRKAISDALVMTDTSTLKDKLFDKLSDGQKQRVMLARAICQDTDIIVLDEPTSFLDIGYKIDIMTLLRELADKGITVIMTAHDLSLAGRVSDRVISIKDGRVDREGTAAELISDEYLCELFGVRIDKYKEFYG